MTMPGCCLRHFKQGESFCPVCEAQKSACEAELEQARNFEPKADDLTRAAHELLRARAIPQFEFRGSTRGMVALAQKNPNRRKVFELFGFYLPEREARDLLKKIHDFKWIEAEKSGRDIWQESHAGDPFATAANTWASRYLEDCVEKLPPQAA